VIGSSPLSRGQVVSKMWEYIRSHNLQNPENRREILADESRTLSTQSAAIAALPRHERRTSFHATAPVPTGIASGGLSLWTKYET
jgi:hypothetical protein